MNNPFEPINARLTNLEALSLEILQFLRSTSTNPTTTDAAPILSADQVKEMTGWPDGTFYAKVAKMPEGVVIRGKSKRLLFDREKFMQWLQTPVQP
ncbi:hypothetical protein [uncultured Spirosoma sp.]|uniref:hypothetical protein n=1 Tax=uncultured Spirosoma sp. TaxID=278208 RepID=UPI00258B2090|nr:hypothetical protein [uncultured Spirosoma sp.]